MNTADCASIEALKREVCAACWELTDGMGPDGLTLEFKDEGTGHAVVVDESAEGDELALLDACRACTVPLKATFKNGKRAYDVQHLASLREKLWEEAEQARREMERELSRAAEAKARSWREGGTRGAEDAGRALPEGVRSHPSTMPMPLPNGEPPPLPPEFDEYSGPGSRTPEVERALRWGEENLWGVLGVDRGSGHDHIRRACLASGRAAHPDKNPHDQAAATAAQQLINLAVRAAAARSVDKASADPAWTRMPIGPSARGTPTHATTLAAPASFLCLPNPLSYPPLLRLPVPTPPASQHVHVTCTTCTCVPCAVQCAPRPGAPRGPHAAHGAEAARGQPRSQPSAAGALAGAQQGGLTFTSCFTCTKVVLLRLVARLARWEQGEIRESRLYRVLDKPFLREAWTWVWPLLPLQIYEP